MTAADPVAAELVPALRAAVAGEVDAGARRRAEYSSDASNYRRVPLAVVFPRDTGDVAAVIATCRAAGVPVTARGGGTSIGGQAVGPGVVMDCSRHLNRILELDPDRRLARVQPGVVLDDLQRAAAPHGLRFGPDPSSHGRATLGGMIGNNACGSHSVAWGRTSDSVEALDLLLDDASPVTVGSGPAAAGGRYGEIQAALSALASDSLADIRTGIGRFSRDISGYALDHLTPERGFHVARSLVGSEGTCAFAVGATVSLVPVPAARSLLVLGFAGPVAAADAVPTILPHRPLTVEGIDEVLVGVFRGRRHVSPELPDGHAWLYVELAGDSPAGAAAAARRLAAELGTGHGVTGSLLVDDPERRRLLWRVREDGAGLTTRLPDGGEAWPGWEDAAVPPDRLGDYLRAFDGLMARHGRRGVLYGHFGEGCPHIRIDFDLRAPDGPARYRAFVEEAADLVVAHGGSLSGEHGDGRARSELLARQFGAAGTALFGRFKRAWDPAGLFNPGILVDPEPLDTHLRLAAPAHAVPLALALPHDGGDLSRAVHRCVGVGRCRTAGGGVMCPSFRATRDERDSTRGRARVLQEMLLGEIVTDGWRSPEVRDALDLCLGCKGCLSDCPVGVDMAAYRTEFLHQHYRHRLRPATHYSLGFLPWWAGLASRAPRAVNAVAARPRLGALLRRASGIAAERQLPPFATRTFRAWWRRRDGSDGPVDGPAGREVLLWPDTFTDHFLPEVARSAVEVLEAAGLRVRIPRRRVCCGLTWASTGQLDLARRALRRALDTVEPHLRAGVPIIGLEPSCTALLREDAARLLPADDRVRLLAGSVRTFAEALEEHAGDWTPAPIRATAVVQTHCHQHAVLGTAADRRLLDRLGVQADWLDAGCCGLAGDFGFSAAHHAVSVAVAEHALLPDLRARPADTVVLADGFSCRTQIEQLAGRRPLHLAELARRGVTS